MSIRRAMLPNDTQFILALVQYVSLTIFPEASDIESAIDQWFVIEYNGGIVGCVAARKSNGEIRHITVHPSHRRRGIGCLLVRHATEYLKAMGCRNIWAQIRVSNKESLTLFKRCGFNRDERTIRSSKDPTVQLYRCSLPINRDRKET